MLFNSFEFILLFLPAVFILFWYCGRSLRWRLTLLTLASYFFYSWWQFHSVDDFLQTLRWNQPRGFAHFLWAWRFTLVMLFSSSVDYWAGKLLADLPMKQRRARRSLLALSLTVNLGLLAFFKYAGFFSQIADHFAQALHAGSVPIISVILPVGISFYTFESMSYVIDVYRGIARPAKGYLDYACFISFFPHLVAGPIIRYSDILHQFRDVHWVAPDPDWEQVSRGLLLLTMGMAKKLLIADPIATAINPLWDSLGTHHAHLSTAASWAAVLGYAFRIYFDFSGYSDMATGIGHLFAVRLPQNFNSPYKATDPSDFWRRWHITLSLWLRDYLYFPLGGSRCSLIRTCYNLMITMLLGGLWHGAAWLFILWGGWHGAMLAGWHLLKKWFPAPKDADVLAQSDSPVLDYAPHGLGRIVSGKLVKHWVSRQTTFLLVCIGWVFFRGADVHGSQYSLGSIQPALDMLRNMFIPHAGNVKLPGDLLPRIALAWVWCNFLPNSFQIAYGLKLRPWHALAAGALMALCVLSFGTPVDFMYFRF